MIQNRHQSDSTSDLRTPSAKRRPQRPKSAFFSGNSTHSANSLVGGRGWRSGFVLGFRAFLALRQLPGMAEGPRPTKWRPAPSAHGWCGLLVLEGTGVITDPARLSSGPHNGIKKGLIAADAAFLLGAIVPRHALPLRSWIVMVATRRTYSSAVSRSPLAGASGGCT